jgi:glycosyltransferase involved in cell wall biosynthesis
MRCHVLKKVAVVSLHFSPGHVSHLFAYGKLLRAVGLEPLYILDQPYLDFADFTPVAPTLAAQTYFASPHSYPLQAAIFYNAAVKNASAARAMRQRRVEVLYVFHEPEPVRYRMGVGWKTIPKLLAANLSSIAMLRRTSTVLVASDYGQDLYRKYFAKYNSRVYTIPLLFEDEVGERLPGEKERKYFSYIGNIAKSHGFDDFVRCIRFSIQNRVKTQFLIASKSRLPKDVEEDPYIAATPGLVRFECGKALSNHAMNTLFMQSRCVWNLYTVSTQSGVLARAMMCGAPVVASSSGSASEFISDGREGRLLETREPDAVFSAYDDICSNLDRYSARARERFFNTFYYKAQAPTWNDILSSLGSEQLRGKNNLINCEEISK